MNMHLPPLVCYWLGRHQAGDPGARPELLSGAQDAVRAAVHRLSGRFAEVRRWEEVGDICQNVLIRLDRVLRARPVADPTDFGRLIACLARRELIDLARRYAGMRWRGCAVPAGGAADHPDASAADPLRAVIWQEVHARIASLPAEDRRLFDLLYYQGFSQPEAAAVLRLSLRTLKRKWQTSRTRLRGVLGNESPF